MRKFLSLITTIILSVASISVYAQKNYTTHKIENGETLSTIAKANGTTVGDIMRLNGMHSNSKLVTGSTIKIPSTNKTITQPATQVQAQSQIRVIPGKKEMAVNETSVAKKHVVVKGESLYSIAKKYHVTIKQLETWNHLTNGNIKPGSSLIVSSISTVTTPIEKKQRVETTAATAGNVASSTPDTLKTIKQQSETANTTTAAKPSTPPVTTTQQPSSAIESSTDAKIDAAQMQAQTNATTATVMAADDAVKNANQTTQSTVSGAGFFENAFKSKGMQQVSGISKTFKTTSGWNDGKYYVLVNNINPGTIVKLTAENGNTIYAKVLGNMVDQKENNGVNFRISDAAAAALKESALSFNLTIYY